MIVNRNDGFGVPLTNGFQITRSGGIDSIDRSVILPRLQPAELLGLAVGHFGLTVVRLSVVVKNLNFHPVAGRMPALGDSDSDSVISALFEFEFEMKREVTVFFFCV